MIVPMVILTAWEIYPTNFNMKVLWDEFLPWEQGAKNENFSKQKFPAIYSNMHDIVLWFLCNLQKGEWEK